MMIIKIGGGSSINDKGIAADLSAISPPFIIVHGANALRDSLAERLDIPRKTVTSVSGYSSVYSDSHTIDLQMMAYAGLRNKRLVELFQQHGINAVGLSGIDGGIIRARRNPGIRVREDKKIKILRDFSGKPLDINRKLLDLLLSNAFIPVLTVPLLDETHTAVNSENDDIVALLQLKYQSRVVIHLIEAPGLLKDPSDPLSLIPQLSAAQLVRLESQSEGRIKRKLLAIKRLFENGAEKVIIADGRTEHPLQDALDGKGTVIR